MPTIPPKTPTQSFLCRILRTLGQWAQRTRGRHQLAQLNDQQLSDLCISSCERMAELEKPFWRE